MELDPYVQCPYDKVHFVPRSRIQGHLIKCEKRYPPLSICPYNATHRMPYEQMVDHVRSCPTRALNYPEPCQLKITAPRTTLQRQNIPEMDPNHEFWD